MRKLRAVLSEGSRRFTYINRIFFYSACVVVMLVWFLVLVNIVVRKMHLTFVGLIEISEYLILLMVFLGAAFLLSEDRHVKMDLVISHINKKGQGLVNIVTYSFALIAWSILAVESAIIAWEHYQTGYYVISALNFPRAPLHTVVAVGSFLLALQLSIMIRGYFSELKQIAVLNQKKPASQAYFGVKQR